MTIELTKPTMPSAAACQRPGTNSRFMPISMKPVMQASTTIIHSALLVKTKALPSRFPKIGLIWN